MSTVESAVEAVDEVCANCGIAALDNVKLKKCACLLVQYCGVECQKNHRPHHKKACKKRLAELREDLLFMQPDESHLGDCPICCLPVPLEKSKSILHSCCCKLICIGCHYTFHVQGRVSKCPFCREPIVKTVEEGDRDEMKRMMVNDPVALRQMGAKRYEEGDYNVAFDYLTKAAVLGDICAHFCLGCMYYDGNSVEKDTKKAVYHFEQAAIGGHPGARHIERAAKHFIIGAKLGHDLALERVKERFAKGVVSKEDFDAARRGHQAAVDATKSQQRDAAYAYQRQRSMNEEKSRQLHQD